MSRRRLPLLVAFVALAPGALRAQQAESQVEALVPILSAADARAWNEGVLRRGLVFPDSTVRRQAALAVGRIGDPAGVELLVPVLEDTVISVRAAAAFALGLLRDTTAVAPLVRRLVNPPELDPATATEAVTALANIGGPAAGDFFQGLLSRRERLAVTDTDPVYARAVLDAWRLGPDAPVSALLPYLRDESEDLRWRAAFALGRIGSAPPLVKEDLPAALSDNSAFVRANAARGLTRGFADSAGVAGDAIADLLARALSDADPQVRINAARSLGSFRRSGDAAAVAALVGDQNPGVALQAVVTLGDLGGTEAAAALQRVLADDRRFALRREALLGLARADSAAFRQAVGSWAGSRDWRERAAAGEGAGRLMPGSGAEAFLRDADGRVVAAALRGWLAAGKPAAGALAAEARPLLSHQDVMVRAYAATALARTPDAADVPALAAAFRRAATDSVPDAGIEALDALASISRAGPDGRTRVEREFLATVPRPADYVLVRWAEDFWPEAADRWGAAYPLKTGRTPSDYRDIARRLVLPTSPERLQHVTIEVDQKGTVELELFGDEAPLTVASFLSLVDRRYFDGLRIHGVVPNFVVQDGDPRGDGSGGPAYAIRDEVNMRRYEAMMIGMALAGPDTGGSQWFVNLSPQPSLDGIYTVFGRVVTGQGTLLRVLPGDLIRTIHR